MYLTDFIAANANWEELLAGDPYNLKIDRDNGYIIFKYNQLSSDFTNQLVKECRGIILREADMKIVCHPFHKFMNAEEPNSDLEKIDWNTASVQTKIDGSLIKVWFDDGWHISTNGTIDAFKADLNNAKYTSFGALFVATLCAAFGDEHIFFEKLNPANTYMFELVSPYNRVVIDYSKPKVYFLGLRDGGGCEHDPKEDLLSKFLEVPRRYNLTSYSAVKQAAEALPWSEEGYVVCDSNFNRVKIKSPEYVRAHYARMNNCISKTHLLDIIRAGEQAEFLAYASDYAEELAEVEAAYNSLLSEIHDKINELNPQQYVSRKDYALVVKQQPTWLQSFLFAYDKIDTVLARLESKKIVELLEQAAFRR